MCSGFKKISFHIFIFHVIAFLFLIEEVCEMLSDPANGQVTFSNERFVGSVATYICELGYNRNGTETRVCQSGSGWSETEPSCESELKVFQRSTSE